MPAIGFRDFGLHVDPAVDITDHRVDQHQQIRVLFFNGDQPLGQNGNLAGAAHIARGHRFQFA
ncbi:hypothetical protein D3C76_1545420 [compost metagenome]